MKQLILTLILFSGFIFSYQAHAINSEKAPAQALGLSVGSQMTINDFIAFDAKNYRSADGKKLKWTQRLAFNIVKKNLERKIKKGKIDGDMTMDKAGKAAGGNIYGLLSLIFSIVGLFIPIIGLGLLIAAFVLGLIGLRRDNNPTMALIGLIVSGVFLLLILIVIAVGISLLWV